MVSRALRLSIWGCWIVAAATAAVGGVIALMPETIEPSLEIDRTDVDLGDLPLRETSVVFRIANPSAKPAEVVQRVSEYGRNCFFNATQERQTSIGPGETVELVWKFGPQKAGSFELNTEIYFIGVNVQIVPIRIHGTAISPAGQ